MKPARKPLNIRIESDLFYRLKIESARSNMSKVLEDALNPFLTEQVKLSKPLKIDLKQTTLSIDAEKYEVFKKLYEEVGISLEQAVQQVLQNKFSQPPHSEE